MSDESIRLQKYLSERGVASRRQCEELIAQGRVSVNGAVVTTPGTRVVPARDAVQVSGRVIPCVPPPPRAVALHKPRGYICSASRSQGRSIFELLPEDLHSFKYAGRLDKDSEGLVILSNGGDFINRVTHPRYGHTKVYRVTIAGRLSRDAMNTIAGSIEINGTKTIPAKVRVLKGGEKEGRTVVEFRLVEGRNRQVRRLCEAARLTVHRLVRTHVGAVALQGIRPGTWRDLTKEEVASFGK